MKTTHVTGAAVLALLLSGSPHSVAADPLRSKPTFAFVDVADFDAIATLGLPVSGRTDGDANESQPFARRLFEQDLEAMRVYRPGFEFWHHVFTIPDGQTAFGSAADGTLLATFPAGKNWARDAMRLEQEAGPVVHHQTRGSFIAGGTERFGSFLEEWGAIFERFGVPAEIGLAQALVESGLRGRIRSGAQAIGLCQWLPRNWARLQKLSPVVIEAYNQTTQAPYCAAHLAILATKYGSLIPALSEHHAGSVNVGRTIINGDFAGGEDVRARYFLGAELTLLLRGSRLPGYRQVVGSYGPRSYRYAEMVFGNTLTIADLETAIPQEQIFAMRPVRSVPFDEVARRTGLSADEIRRFNPALINRVPAGANLYLPSPAEGLGRDTAFWHHEPASEYVAVLDEFLRLNERFVPEDWQHDTVLDDLRAFETRFRETGTEEGTVMATMLAYVIGELSDGRQMEILAEARSSERARSVLEQAVRQREALLQTVDESGGGWALRNALLTGGTSGL